MSSSFLHGNPYIFFLAALTAGIAGADFLPEGGAGVAVYLLAALGGALLLYARQRKCRTAVFLTATGAFIALAGVYLTPSPGLPAGESGGEVILRGRCEALFAPPDKYLIREGNYRFLLQVKENPGIRPGDSITCRARVFPLTRKQHFHDFDYDRYLRHQGIHARAYTRTAEITGHRKDFRTLCLEARESLIRKLRTVAPDTLTASLLEALCLGYREDLHPDTERLFQRTGTVHLLAISGLHMGALYLLFSALFNAMGIRNARSRLGLIPLLWLAVGLTGLSPSACRAAAILSILLVGRAFRQDYSPLNAVAASAFFTLLVNPNLLYSVSFQMSYAAYTGIILFFPPLNRVREHLPRFPGKVYSLMCLSLTAQVATAPLTAYYFHTVNVNGLLVNLIAIPLAMFLLYGGVALLVLPAVVGTWIAPVVTGINRGLFFGLEQFETYSYNLTGVYPSLGHLTGIYLFLALLPAAVGKRSRRAIAGACGILLALTLYHGAWEYRRNHRQEVAVFHYHDRSVVVLNYRGHYAFLKYSGGDTAVPPYVLANGLRPLPANEGFLNSTLHFRDNRLCSARDTLRIADREHPPGEGGGTLVVTGNILPPRETGGKTPRHVILDNTNSPYCREAWRRFCERHGARYTSTGETGSVRIPWSCPRP